MDTFKIVKNTSVSTKIGVARMGSTVNLSDVVNPACVRGMLATGAIVWCDSGKTVLVTVAETQKEAEAKEAPKKETKKAKKKSKSKAKPEDSE